MNNHELATDEFCFTYKRYKKKFPWKHFKRKTWVIQQHLCEKYDLTLIDHRTKMESYVYWFDIIIKKLLKFIRGSGKKKKIDYQKAFFGAGSKKSKRWVKIKPDKDYNFKKMDKNLLGVKKKIWSS